MSASIDVDVPREDCAAVARRLGEKYDGGDGAPNAKLVVNCLYALLRAQRERNKRAPTLKQRITEHGQMVTLVVYRLSALRDSEVAQLYQLSPRVLGVTMQFRDLHNHKQLGYGCVVVQLLRADATTVPARAPYVPPAVRRKRTIAFDYDGSDVRVGDRPLVERVVDQVYNVCELMPLGLTFSLEPITPSNYEDLVGEESETAVSLQKKAGKRMHAEPTVLGYCLHFVGVRSFGAEFFEYLAEQHGVRYLGALVLFPHQVLTRGNGAPTVARQRLNVMLASELHMPQEVRPHALSGARRLRRKLHAATSAQ